MAVSMQIKILYRFGKIPDLVGVKLSGPAETEVDSANDDNEQEVQASESQERPRLSLSILPSPASATVLPTAILHGTVDVLVPLASKKDVDNLERAGAAVRDDQFDEELPGLADEIEEILPLGGNRIDDVLERLMTYKGLNKDQQKIAQNFRDALKLRSLLSPDDYLTDVVLGPLLDGGAFGRVYKGVWGEEEVVVKKFIPVTPPDYLEKPFEENFMSQVTPIDSFKRELDLWKNVSTLPHVWALHGSTMLLDQDEMTIFFALVSPLSVKGYLRLTVKDRLSLKPKKFANYFRDTATGLQSLHHHGVIHGDIRPQNILQDEECCYLIDFGMSKFLHSSSSFSFAPVLAKPHGIPELLDGSVTQRDKKTDIFSFGSTMYKVLAGKTLDIMTGQPERPGSFLGQEWDPIWDLVLRCMSEDPINRPTALELVESLKAICMLYPM
ncbi:kinase-like domain-containing protein [Russula emetica]|nr:kinase-like domain-containing protein [Russula emetica]